MVNSLSFQFKNKKNKKEEMVMIHNSNQLDNISWNVTCNRTDLLTRFELVRTVYLMYLVIGENDLLF